MIIEIEKDYEKYILSSIDSVTLTIINKQIFRKISNMFEQAEKGRIFIRASLDFFETFDKIKSEFSCYVRIYLKSIIANYSTIMSEAFEIKPLIVLCSDNHCHMSTDVSTRISIEDIPDDLNSYLYCEDVDDTDFYIELFNNLMPKYKDKIFINKEGYGGGNVSTLESKLEQNKIFICIADSDKRCSDWALGSTANKIKEFYKNKRPFSCHYILSVHEKENLFPCCMMDTNGFDDNKIKLIEIIQKSNDETKNFFDLKDGVKTKYFKKFSSRATWGRIYIPVKNELLKYGYFYNVDDEDYAIKGIGSNAISKFMESPNLKFDNYISSLTKMQKEDLDNIFNQIIRFGYSSEPVYS